MPRRTSPAWWRMLRAAVLMALGVGAWLLLGSTSASAAESIEPRPLVELQSHQAGDPLHPVIEETVRIVDTSVKPVEELSRTTDRLVASVEDSLDEALAQAPETVDRLVPRKAEPGAAAAAPVVAAPVVSPRHETEKRRAANAGLERIVRQSTSAIWAASQPVPAPSSTATTPAGDEDLPGPWPLPERAPSGSPEQANPVPALAGVLPQAAVILSPRSVVSQRPADRAVPSAVAYRPSFSPD